MKKKLILDENDIHQIIANAFDVSRDKVKLEPYADWEGYGMDEHFVAKVKATVEVPIDGRQHDVPIL